MHSFISRHQHEIQGTLSGFDRLRFVGSLLRLSYVDGLASFLGFTGVLLKEFGDYMLGLSRRIKHASEYLNHRLRPDACRLQTWLPFQLKVVLNGRDWLARQLDDAGIGYLKKDNDFVAPTPLEELTGPLCRRMVKDGRRYRALNPLGEVDARLMEFIGRGDHLIAGFRNRDVQRCLYGERSNDAAVHRRQSGRVSRLLALLRAHGLIQKISKTHRYQVTTRGREQIAAILAARAAGVEKLIAAA